MTTPNADGPDIAGTYQDITGPIDPAWSLFSHKGCEGQRTWDRDIRTAWPKIRAARHLRYRGVYHWVRSDSTPAAQAAHALAVMSELEFGEPGDIWQTDWETTPGIPLMTSVQVAEYNDRIRQARGDDRIVTYSSDWLPDSTLDADARGEFHEWRAENPTDALWFANYNTGDRPTGGWAEIEQWDADVWQWTSRYPTGPNIVSSSGGIDMNHIRRRDRLDRIAGYTTEEDTMQYPNRRLFDSRKTEIVRPGQPVTIAATEARGAAGVIVNLTALGARSHGHLTVRPVGKPAPSTSALNYHGWAAVANAVPVEVSAAGAFVIEAHVAPVHVIADLMAVDS